MPSRTLAMTAMVAALLWSCTSDGTETDPGPEDRPSASSSMGSADRTAESDDAGPEADHPVSVGLARGWSAEITGARGAELPTVSGPSVLVSRSPAQATITGMVGQSGGALTIGLEILEVGENTAHDFNLGFQLQHFRCTSQHVVVSLTQIEPRPEGTFSGPVICEDLAVPTDPIEATVTGEIAG